MTALMRACVVALCVVVAGGAEAQLGMFTKVVDVSEDVRLRDAWGHEMLRQGRYTPGQIDTKWTEAMEAEFRAGVAKRRGGP